MSLFFRRDSPPSVMIFQLKPEGGTRAGMAISTFRLRIPAFNQLHQLETKGYSLRNYFS